MKFNALKFFNEFYKSLVFNEGENFGNESLHYPLMYEAQKYVTQLENFVKKHLFKVYEKFFQAYLRAFNHPENRELERELKFQAKGLTHEFLSMNHETIIYLTNSYGERMVDYFDNIVPRYIINKLDILIKVNHQNLIYQSKINPQKFLPCFIYIMKYIECLNECPDVVEGNLQIKIYNEERKDEIKTKPIYYKLLNVFPQRSYIPKYITITGVGLLDLFWNNLFKPSRDAYIKGKTINKMKKDEKHYPFQTLMNFSFYDFFKKRDYNFEHYIQTDGIGSSVLFKGKERKNKE